MTDRIGYSYRRYLLRADGRIALIYRAILEKVQHDKLPARNKPGTGPYIQDQQVIFTIKEPGKRLFPSCKMALFTQ